MALFGKNSMPDVDNLLTSFYQLDDEARQEIVETIQFKSKYHKDPERTEQENKQKDGKFIFANNETSGQVHLYIWRLSHESNT